MQNRFHSFRFWNILTAWLLFALSTAIYLLTLEDTVSFWDCGEFIAAAHRLQVGHPPGAPVFLLLGRFFSFFSFGNDALVPVMVNSISALASGLTVLFLFWNITWLTRRILRIGYADVARENITVLIAGILGATAYAFSDTFWFSAVEAEVYATSSLFTAMVFWAITRWEKEVPAPSAGRWIVLIACLMGLSIGVHMLNLLTIPALVMVYYFKMYHPTIKGTMTALISSFLILGILVFLFIPWVYKLGSWFDLLAVNLLGLPANTGLVFFLALFFGLIILAIRHSISHRKVMMNYIFTFLAVFMIGFSSYMVILIRSSADPPMDQNNPENAFALVSYLNREQYEEFPLFSGYYYSAVATGVKQKKRGYRLEEGTYVPYYSPDYEFDKRFRTVFPRMHTDRQEVFVSDYEYWGKVGSQKISLPSGERVVLPTFGENLRFFFRYQVGFMYLRYFMWNFAGRQNDIQGHGNAIHGNWISGISVLDEMRLGSQKNLPVHLANNPARNTYFFLPLILGLLGAFYHYRKRKKDFFVVLILFLMTGLAIVVYLNQNPHQPRERDYAYAASFYAFSMWIGIGAASVLTALKGKGKSPWVVAVAGLFLFLAVPGLMFWQNYDDHNRSKRYTARDFAYNYLIGCGDNSILFSYGDNDTFPIWYLQDVEKVRTDVRLINLSYLSAPWYIEQMYRKVYESDPIPFSLTYQQIRKGVRELVEVREVVNRPYPLQELIDFVGSDDPNTMRSSVYQPGEKVNFFPTNQFIIPVDTSSVLENKVFPAGGSRRMIPQIEWRFPGNAVQKNELMVMDLLAEQQWNRAMHFTVTTPLSALMGLETFFREEGFTFRLVPAREEGKEDRFYGFIDPLIMYGNVMNKYRWGNMQDPDVYLDESNRRMIRNFRNMFGRLASSLQRAGETGKALEVLDLSDRLIPATRIPYDYYSVELAEAFFLCGQEQRALEISEKIAATARRELNYYLGLGSGHQAMMDREYRLGIQTLADLAQIASRHNQSSLKQKLLQEANNYYRRYQQMAP